MQHSTLHSSMRLILILALNTLPAFHAFAASTGDQMPGCKLSSLPAKQSAALDSLKGKVVYLDFWASWCPPCVKSFPFMNELTQQYKDKGLEVVGINLDESLGDAEQFLANHAVSFSIMTDPDKSCAEAFNVRAMPSSYLIDRNGTIQHIHLGFRTGETETFKQKIEQLLQESANDS